MNYNIGFVLALVVAKCLVAAGQSVSNTSSVVDAAGGWTSAGNYSNVSAIAQSGGVTVSSAGGTRNYAGFLGTIVLLPSLDTDGDGLNDELDADNDNDGLEDAAELAGSAFSPATLTDLNKSDTDGDGATDGAEAVAGTNPRDAWHNLRFVSVDPIAPGATVGWLARQGKTYRIWRTDSLQGNPAFTSLVATVVANGPAAGPWLVLTNYYTDAAVAPKGHRFYKIEVE